ncbi:Ribosomal protein S2 mitochondrial [Bienertia sinuspersici]
MTIHSVVIQKLLSTNAHLGRKITAQHFKPFIYGTRNGLSIIDSDKTLISLRNSLDFISHLIRNKARFLFVNTNPLFDDIFDHMTRKIGHGSFLSPQAQYWRLGGFLTNSSSPKKFRSRNKKIALLLLSLLIVLSSWILRGNLLLLMKPLGFIFRLLGWLIPVFPGRFSIRLRIQFLVMILFSLFYTVCNLITKTFLLEQKSLNSGDDLSTDVSATAATPGCRI